MAIVTPPPITRPEAQVALVHAMLTEHGRDRANTLFLIDKAMYRISVERVPIDEIPDAARQFLKETPHGNPERD